MGSEAFLGTARSSFRHAARLRRHRVGGVVVLLSAVAGSGHAFGGIAAAAGGGGGGTATAGILTAMLSPLFATVGLILWDTHWRGSAFALNRFQCCLATLLFGAVAVPSAGGIAGFLCALGTTKAVLALFVSAFIGIVVGDSAWLASIQMIGVRRVLVVDSLRPFVAAAAGGIVFGEAATPASIASMGCAVLGVLIVSLEREASGKDSSRRPCDLLKGYVLAVLTVAFDVGGAVLTRWAGTGLGPCTIGFVRFGFAAVCLSAVAAACQAAASARSDGEDEEAPKGAGGGAAPPGARALEGRWYEMPVQSRHAWTRAVAGGIFVTFLCVALTNHALFAAPLGLCLTLGSLGPVFAIPLVWLMRRETVSLRATAGSILAVIGVIVFCNATPLS